MENGDLGTMVKSLTLSLNQDGSLRLSGFLEPRCPCQEKREHMRELEKLKRDAIKAEKDCRLQVFHRREDIEAIDLEVKKLAEERETEAKRIVQTLTTTKTTLKQFKSYIQTRKNPQGKPLKLEEIKSKMTEIESSISTFKTKQKTVYDDLLRHEMQCANEIASLERKMTAWETKRTAPASARSARPEVIEDDENKPPALIAFDKFLQLNGGPTGGWIDEDHAIFLRVRGKHKGKSSWMSEALPLLAPKSAEDLEPHETWFKEFSTLLKAKKEAIRGWKQQKVSQRKEESATYQKVEAEDEEERLRRQQERRKQEEKERGQKDAEIAAWKVKKELQRIEDEEKKIKEELEKKKREEAENIRKAEVKLKAAKFARAKELARMAADAAEAAKVKEEMAIRRKIASEEIRFQERDQMTVAQRLVFNAMKVEEAKERDRRLEKIKENVAVKADRDPDRLTRPTKGAELRAKATEADRDLRQQDGGRNDACFNIRQVQSRGTPSWRAGI